MLFSGQHDLESTHLTSINLGNSCSDNSSGINTDLTANIVEIVERASSIDERMTNVFLPRERQPSSPLYSSSYLNHWCQTVAQGNWHRFQQRLQWDNWKCDRISSVLHGVNRVQS